MNSEETLIELVTGLRKMQKDYMDASLLDILEEPKTISGMEILFQMSGQGAIQMSTLLDIEPLVRNYDQPCKIGKKTLPPA